VHQGLGLLRKRQPLRKYKALGEKLHEFYEQVRDAQGAVTPSLLQDFISSLPQDIQLDLMAKADHRRD
jgi:hypothetical protein